MLACMKCLKWELAGVRVEAVEVLTRRKNGSDRHVVSHWYVVIVEQEPFDEA